MHLTADSQFERMRAIADAILYEGYLLYPYRKSSAKNQIRWQFGIVAPRGWAERAGPVPDGVAGSVESWQQQTECLVEARPGARVRARVRFLQLQAKVVERRDRDGRYHPVECIDVAGTRHLTFDEAVPIEIDLVAGFDDRLGAGVTRTVTAPGGTDIEDLGPGARIVRRRWPVSATAALSAEHLAGTTAGRLRVRYENTGPAVAASAPRNEALRHALIATHTLLGGEGLTYHSLIEPAEWLAPHARSCRNVHTFPVLAGDGMLSSPILLYDHPRIAPESPGDLHDSAEIDEILSLRTLTLTDEEKREARATDPRAAEIVDRVDGMPGEVLARLHGVVRSLRPADTTEGGTDGPDGRHRTPRT